MIVSQKFFILSEDVKNSPIGMRAISPPYYKLRMPTLRARPVFDSKHRQLENKKRLNLRSAVGLAARKRHSLPIQWTPHSDTGPAQHMRVDHRRAYIAMTK